MMVAGIGCRRGVDTTAVLAAIDAALGAHNRQRSDLAALATIPRKAREPGIMAAATSLRLALLVPAQAALQGIDTTTRSPASETATGLASACEASALAACGEGARLLGSRTIVGPATCALAVSDRP